MLKLTRNDCSIVIPVWSLMSGCASFEAFFSGWLYSISKSAHDSGNSESRQQCHLSVSACLCDQLGPLYAFSFVEYCYENYIASQLNVWGNMTLPMPFSCLTYICLFHTFPCIQDKNTFFVVSFVRGNKMTNLFARLSEIMYFLSQFFKLVFLFSSF